MTNNWDWLPRDDNGNPIFDDMDDVIFVGYLKDQLMWEPEARPGHSEMRGPSRVTCLLLLLIPVAAALVAWWRW